MTFRSENSLPPKSAKSRRSQPHQTLQDLAESGDQVGVIIVDHGSRRAASNQMLAGVVEMFRTASRLDIVEAAHMELAEPSIDTAMRQCVAQGATLVVVFPHFLLPGRHWSSDIPRLVAEAARQHAGLRYVVTAPLALHPLIADVIQQRIGQCLEKSLHGGPSCEVCDEQTGCTLLGDASSPAK